MSSLENQDIGYYCSNLQAYANTIKVFFQPIHQALRAISDLVVKIGGEGKIHGTIVDIDYYNHINLDPSTFELSCYFAQSVSNQKYYKDVPELLKHQRRDLYQNYLKESSLNSVSLTLFRKNDSLSELSKSTINMYKSSSVLRDLQHLIDSGIVRRWEYSFFEDLLLEAITPLPLLDGAKELKHENNDTFYSIRQYSQEGKFLNQFPSIQEAIKLTNIPEELIELCIKKKKHPKISDIWRKEIRYLIPSDLDFTSTQNFGRIKVALYKENEKIAEYGSITEAAKMTDFTKEAISKSIHKKSNDGNIRHYDPEDRMYVYYHWEQVHD